jgi:hypothetical protein
MVELILDGLNDVAHLLFRLGVGLYFYEVAGISQQGDTDGVDTGSLSEEPEYSWCPSRR